MKKTVYIVALASFMVNGETAKLVVDRGEDDAGMAKPDDLVEADEDVARNLLRRDMARLATEADGVEFADEADDADAADAPDEDGEG